MSMLMDAELDGVDADLDDLDADVDDHCFERNRCFDNFNTKHCFDFRSAIHMGP